jgi:hypothetical protein
MAVSKIDGKQQLIMLSPTHVHHQPPVDRCA